MRIPAVQAFLFERITPETRRRQQSVPEALPVQELLTAAVGASMMSLVRLLGFTTLGCGCVTGRYREVATNREVTYVEEKGTACEHPAHRRNHTLAPARRGLSALSARAS
jgi:hypothetical protein